MSYDGYIAAKEWCELNDIDYESLLNNELSKDGYTFIALVNALKERRQCFYGSQREVMCT
jgi:hypothetical protein